MKASLIALALFCSVSSAQSPLGLSGLPLDTVITVNGKNYRLQWVEVGTATTTVVSSAPTVATYVPPATYAAPSYGYSSYTSYASPPVYSSSYYGMPSYTDAFGNPVVAPAVGVAPVAVAPVAFRRSLLPRRTTVCGPNGCTTMTCGPNGCY